MDDGDCLYYKHPRSFGLGELKHVTFSGSKHFIRIIIIKRFYNLISLLFSVANACKVFIGDSLVIINCSMVSQVHNNSVTQDL